MTTDRETRAAAGVMDLFPGADRQALRCLAELMAKQASEDCSTLRTTEDAVTPFALEAAAGRIEELEAEAEKARREAYAPEGGLYRDWYWAMHAKSLELEKENIRLRELLREVHSDIDQIARMGCAERQVTTKARDELLEVRNRLWPHVRSSSSTDRSSVELPSENGPE